MFNVINVTKAFGPKKLFEDVSVSFSAGRRYGLTGPNGAGKSTFMKILAGDLEPDTGQISRPKKYGVLRQDQFAYEEDRVLDVVLMGNKPLWAAMKEKDTLLAKSEITEADGNRLADLEGVIAEEDGYVAESDAAALLEGLGIGKEFHEGKMKEVAGGLQAARAPRPGALRQAAGPAPRRAHEQPRPRLDPLAGELPPRVRGRADHHLATTGTS